MKYALHTFIAATILACLPGCTTPAIDPKPSVSSTTSQQAQIKTQISRVADWQLANMTNFDIWVRKPSKQTYNPRGWVQGTFFVGLADAADATRDPKYDQALKEIASANNWKLGDRLTHADDHLVAMIYARFAKKEKQPSYIEPSRMSFDKIIALNSQVSLEFIEKPGSESHCQDRWCWADALYMAPAAWMAVGVASGNDKYITYADKEFWASTGYLFDKEAGLFYRDSRFFPQRGPDGEKVYWARGNGWVFGGIANILRVLPKNHPSRGRYIALFKQMAAALVSVQQNSGFWHTSLAAKRPEAPETSGTGFFTYGLAYGVNEGMLTDTKFKRAARLGWAGLNQHVSAQGRLGYVQQVGDRPGDVQPDDAQYYGTGAYLQAAVQMLKLEGGK